MAKTKNKYTGSLSEALEEVERETEKLKEKAVQEYMEKSLDRVEKAFLTASYQDTPYIEKFAHVVDQFCDAVENGKLEKLVVRGPAKTKKTPEKSRLPTETYKQEREAGLSNKEIMAKYRVSSIDIARASRWYDVKYGQKEEIDKRPYLTKNSLFRGLDGGKTLDQVKAEHRIAKPMQICGWMKAYNQQKRKE